MFVRSYLDTAEKIIESYNGAEPLAQFLKRFFAGQKKFGSRDRKQISHLVYCYFRLGNALQNVAAPDQLLAGIFLCSQSAQPVLQALKPAWGEAVGLPLSEKIDLVSAELGFDVTGVFPLMEHVSEAIDKEAFSRSFLIQPDTFLRIRPGKGEKVLAQLEDAGIDYRVLPGQTVAVPPAAKLDDLLMLDRDAVVQDRSSQQVISLLVQRAADLKKDFSVWDCCAASGGKSLLLHDHFPKANLTASDIRPTILTNLRKRFERAGIDRYHWFVGDLSASDFKHQNKYDVVLCDAPCSGSGTWGRTPEWLRFFPEEKIAYYATLQQKIATTAAQNIRSGGYLLYITCSVFNKENEEVVSKLQQHQLELVGQQYFTGYHQKADTLFAALLRKV